MARYRGDGEFGADGTLTGMLIVWIGGEVSFTIAIAVYVAVAIAVTVAPCVVFEVAKGKIRDPRGVGVAGKDYGIVDVVEGHVADETVPVGRIAVPLVKVSKMSEERRNSLN